MRSVAVLGATGSIGAQALDVIAARPDLRACALSAHRDAAGLAAAARATGARLVALSDPDAAADAPEIDGVTTFTGDRAVAELIEASGADLVLNAIVGAAGLRATLASFAAGADVALANKESLVAGGELVLAAQRASGRLLIPVDSEHSALAQCLAGAGPETVTGLVITASGGPFRGRRREELAGVTAAEALAHPTWSMGRKITIDSATLMNKGLEVIEGHHLFAIPYDAIEVVVHPQSIVHGMVRFRDGALLAHVGNPDMRVPISWALTHPAREATVVPTLDLTSALSLEFEPVDAGTFRCLALAREAGIAGGTAPCILNAANEVAVHAFLDGRIGFLDIAAVVEEALERVPAEPLESLDQVLEADRRARAAAAGAGAAAA
ncbi:MAG TPA: 1-deoxy-D-xylulose-5-phosphate reductoisomerase [Gaiellales bacterium]|jgi:1-deoxy-D-xylulose-5-phosphate reductoisomerase|nr:1-deoxy-D-xylulose-5-phosphate reductoisomerase [Gaiellales bacterium]